MPKIARGIYLRGKTYWYRVQIDGQRRSVSLKTDDEAEAITRAALFKRDETFDAVQKAKGTTFTAEVERYLASKKQTFQHYARTTEWSKGALKQFAAHIHEKNVKNVTPDDIRSFYAALRKRVKPNGELLSENSARAYVRAVHVFFTWTVLVRKLRFDNPCKQVKLGKAVQPARVHFATKEQRWVRDDSKDAYLHSQEQEKPHCTPQCSV
jgi:hypothetical protein